MSYLDKLKEYEKFFILKYDENIDKITRDTKIYRKCKICGEEKISSIRQLLMKPPEKRCKTCELKKSFEEKVINKYGKLPFEYIDPFQGMTKRIKLKCLNCGNIIERTPTYIINEINRKYENNYNFCERCANNERYGKDIKLLEQELEKTFDECRYEFKQDHYFRYKHIDVKCKICGYEFSVLPNNLIGAKYNKHTNHYCPNCNNKIFVKDKTYEERLKEKWGNKFVVLEDFKGMKTPIHHMCTVCGYGSNGEWKSSPQNRLKQDCPKCKNIYTRSRGEKELTEYIKSIYDGEIILNSREIIYPHEIDIFIPDKKIGIEFCGLYWHNEKFKGKDYHLNKLKKANKKGIHLIQVFEDEWLHKEKIVKAKIKHILGLNNNPKIYARKCEIKEISSKDKNNFLEENHIQGKDKSSIKLGLFYNHKLISVMTFSKLRRITGEKINNDEYYELVRFASDIDYLVIGAFSKLLKYFIKNYQPKMIKTYADLRWSDTNDNVYNKNGFIKIRNSEPNYWYVHKNDVTLTRLHRFNFRKSILKNKLEFFDPELTEVENMYKNNYYRIFDCGNAVYVFQN